MFTNRLFIFFTLFSIFIFCLTTGITGINYLPAIVRSKLRSSIQFSTYQTNYKLWMKFLEKRLEMIIIFSENTNHVKYFLEFFKNNFAKNLFNVIPSNCKALFPEGIDGLQIGILWENL